MALITLNTNTAENTISVILEWIAFYGLKVLAAVLIFFIGQLIAKLIRSITQKVLAKKELDGIIISFVSNVVYVALMTFVIIAAIAQLGIQTTSFIAVMGAAGLAICLALQGSLSNFASGFLLIVFHPFKKGDYIEGAGTAGIVEDIQIFATTLITPDNKTVIIPNAKLTGDNIVNYTVKGTRRVDLEVGVSYSDDLDKVRKVLQDIANADGRILNAPAPMIAVKELADSSVNFVFRVWSKTDDYWDVFFDTTETVKKRFDEEGICIPFPQSDVHLYRDKA